jgi:outer membrane receptor for ferrienterochelin and colicin
VNEQLTLLANYTYQQIQWHADVPLIDKEISTPPKHKFMIGSRFSPTQDLHLSSNLYWVDATEAPDSTWMVKPLRVDPYFRLDLRAEYEFWDDQAALAVGVKNLLDEGHYEGGTVFLHSAEVPRIVYAEIRMTLP